MAGGTVMPGAIHVLLHLEVEFGGIFVFIGGMDGGDEEQSGVVDLTKRPLLACVLYERPKSRARPELDQSASVARVDSRIGSIGRWGFWNYTSTAGRTAGEMGRQPAVTDVTAVICWYSAPSPALLHVTTCQPCDWRRRFQNHDAESVYGVMEVVGLGHHSTGERRLALISHEVNIDAYY
ncbi:hypothetical protein ACLOJK_030959 [Asimina triloba]